MKRSLLLFIIGVITIACGDARQSRETASLSQAYVTPYTYTAWNGQTALPSARNNDSVCAFTYLGGSNGHAGTPTWPNGTPKPSAGWYFERNTGPGRNGPFMDAMGATSSAGGSSILGILGCAPFANFDAPVSPQQPSQIPGPLYGFTITDPVSAGRGPHTLDAPIWEGDAFCYLQQVRGLNVGTYNAGTQAFVWKEYGPWANGFRWHLRMVGVSGGSSASANCARFGRPYYAFPIRTAYSNAPVNLDFTQPEATCAISGVWGNLDDGGVQVYATQPGPPDWNVYRLQVSGGVWAAQAHCAGYYWDAP